MMLNIKEKAKNILSKLFPDIFGVIMAIRSRRSAERQERNKGLPSLSKELIDEYGLEVQRGPFEGMLLPEYMKKRHSGKYILGTYEKELHNYIYKFTNFKYDRIFNIGSSFGYYAIGFAMIMEGSTIYAYDLDPWARKLTKETARKNKCKNVKVKGRCTPSSLSKNLLSRSLIFSDCEGYEYELVSGLPKEEFEKSDAIIEFHKEKSDVSVEKMIKNIEETHIVERVQPDGRNGVENWGKKYIKERRGGDQEWLVCFSKLYM